MDTLRPLPEGLRPSGLPAPTTVGVPLVGTHLAAHRFVSNEAHHPPNPLPFRKGE